MNKERQNSNMMPVETHKTFQDAHKRFFEVLMQNPELSIGARPINVSEINATYVLQCFDNIWHCEYRIDDKQYTRTEIKRLLKHKN